jgi:hypothetical protein
MSTRRKIDRLFEAQVRYPNLASFLADHFGGYPSAEDAVAQEGRSQGYADVNGYVESYTEGLDDAQLAEVDQFLATQRAPGTEPWQPMRDKYFDDCGNVLPTVRASKSKVPPGLTTIIANWN